MPAAAPHIALLCSYLHVSGGYEKAVVTLANLFCEKGHAVTLIILDTTKEIFYPIDPRVRVEQQALSFGISQEGTIISRKIRLLGDVLKLRTLLKTVRPDHVIATEYPFAAAAVLTGAGRRMKLYMWEHHHYGAVSKSGFWKFVSEKAFRRLHAIVCLNADEARHYSAFNTHTVTIPNFTPPPSAEVPPYESRKRTDLLSVTRFTAIKGTDLLMQVAEQVLTQQPGLTWKLIGYGPEEENVKLFIKEKGLENRLFIQAATVADINEEYQQASLLVLTSRNECFPLVLLEAMRNGLPAVSFDCDTGPRHIIRQDQTGILTPPADTARMAGAILGLLNDPVKRKEMSRTSLEEAKKYYPDAVYEEWRKLLQETGGGW